MATCREALELIKEFEGYHERLPDGSCRPYRDPVGIPTVGVGSIWRMDGSRVEMSDPPISYEQAMALLNRELTLKCEPAVDRLILVPMHSLMRGALISFAYNLGSGALKASGLRKAINEQRWGDARGEFAKYRMAGGRVLPGLVRRRAAEADMFLKGVAALRQGKVAADQGWITEIARAAA